MVFTMDHMENIRRAAVAVREAFPGLRVYARAWDVRMAKRLGTLGVDYTVPETLAAGQQLSQEVLQASGVPAETPVKIVEESFERKRPKVAKSPATHKKMGYSDILLVLTPGIDVETTLDFAASPAADNGAALPSSLCLRGCLSG